MTGMALQKDTQVAHSQHRLRQEHVPAGQSPGAIYVPEDIVAFARQDIGVRAVAPAAVEEEVALDPQLIRVVGLNSDVGDETAGPGRRLFRPGKPRLQS